MPNFAASLKAELARIARKEVRVEIEALKKAVAGHRAEIASLKRRAQAAEQALKQVRKAVPAAAPKALEDSAPRIRRFSPKTLQAQRMRLGLSAGDVGLLVGATSQSIYNWERGSAIPRQKHLAAIAALKTLGKKTAAAHLDSLRQTAA
ncbi:helix-turn-helix domain-containing protein [Rhizobacter fulvus]